MDIFNNLCCSCNIKKEKLLNIFNVQENAIKDMLEYCLQTTLINESKYPQFMCYDCFKQLQISYRFIKRYHLSQREFQESYNRLQRIMDVTTGDSSVNPDHGLDKKSKCPKEIEFSSIKNSPSATCPLCIKTFYTKKALNLHFKLSHKPKRL